MIGAYFGSTSLSQCMEANRRMSRTDCCSMPSNCNAGNSFSAVADYWGYPHTNDVALSFAAIKAQINAGQPVVSRWAWTGGGAHFITVDGYWVKSNGTNHVEIVNPEPVNVGDTEWATYDVYLNGGMSDDGSKTWGDHTTTNTYYGFSWAPVCDYDFFGVYDGDYQQCFDQHSGRGQYPSAIANGDDYMAGAFHASNHPVAWNNVLSDFNTWVNNHSSTSRPDFITVQSGTTPVYSASLVAESNAWVSQFALDAAGFQSSFNTYTGQGYRPRDIFAYDNNGTPNFSGTWVKESGGYSANHELALSDLNSTDNAQWAAGRSLVRLSTYIDGNGVWRVAALWLPSTVSAYHWVANATGSNFQSIYNTWVKTNGYTMTYVSKYNDYYTIIFTK
jgi:hypothetical protein